MGWTSTHAEHYTKMGEVDRKAECDKVLASSCNVLKSVLKGSVYYGAVEMQDKRGGKIVTGVIIPTAVDRKDYYNFSYRLLTEADGANYYDCPLSILKLLTPTQDKIALNWRVTCKKKAEYTKVLNSLGVGSVIKYKNQDGTERICTKHPPAYQFKKPFWYCADEGMYVRQVNIPFDFEVIKKV